jgi:predicted phosphodiesterase
MRLWALSDLHVAYPINREAIAQLPAHPQDWLILGGDLGETPDQVRWILDTLGGRYQRLLWVPGNHELYTTGKDPVRLNGVARYEHLVGLCRRAGVLTPEDPWPLWPGDGPPTMIAPLFVPYDYSFGPPGLSREQVKAWAADEHIVSTDELLIKPEPYAHIGEWCAARVKLTEARLQDVPPGVRLVLINHWPLRQDLVRLYRIPRFAPWCGTTATEPWLRRFPVDVVVYGHLHMRSTDWREGVRHEEVSLGYPRHWRQEAGVSHYLRQILPGPPAPPSGESGPEWRR